MIEPIKLISAKTRVASPIALNPSMAYKNMANYAFKGQKLNINCASGRSTSQQGQKLNILA